MWAAPTSTNANGNGYQVSAFWASPKASDGPKGGPNQRYGNGDMPLPSQVLHAANLQMGGSSAAPTAKLGASRSLNPEFSLWLLGYPKGWLD